VREFKNYIGGEWVDAASGETFETTSPADAKCSASSRVRREDAERFIEEMLGDDPELASYLRNEERELEARLYENDRPLAARFSLARARTSRGRTCRT
jgi:acyl-CoA reductase-like NAD-dependent aldehyde dehydrogenase